MMNDLPPVRPVEAQIRDIQQQVEIIKQGLAAVSKPWYRDGTTVVASLAFVFSLATTVFSYPQSQQARFHDQRVELRSLIQRQTDLEKELITRTLAECNWNKSLAAKRIGIGRRTLYDKAVRLGIPLKPDGD